MSAKPNQLTGEGQGTHQRDDDPNGEKHSADHNEPTGKVRSVGSELMREQSNLGIIRDGPDQKLGTRKTGQGVRCDLKRVLH